MPGSVALASLLVALLLAPMVLGTHVVVQRASSRTTTVWLVTLLGLSLVSVALAAIGLLLTELSW
jgi:hypothetical protein